jgi:hypothetical protein
MKESIRQHLKKYHNHIVESSSNEEIRTFLSVIYEAAAKTSVDDCLVGDIKHGFQCLKCSEIFQSNRGWNFERHLESRKGKCSGEGASTTPITYRNTRCFRRFPVDDASAPPCPPTTSITVDQEATSAASSLQQSDYTMSNSTALALDILFGGSTTTGSTAEQEDEVVSSSISREIMRPYVRHDESTDIWAIHFESLMSSGVCAASNFQARIVQLVKWWSDDVDESEDAYLSEFLKLAKLWFDQYANNQLKRIPANIRNRLIVFDAHEYGGNLYGGSFYLRKTDGKLGEEYRRLLAFCWRYEGSYLEKYKQWFKRLVDVHETQEKMISLAVLPKFLLAVYFQQPLSPRDPPPIVVQYCLARSFRGFSKTNQSDSLSMIDCQAAGTRMSNTLHLLRAGLLGVVFFWPRDSWHKNHLGDAGSSWIKHATNLVEHARLCYVTNIISPMIADTRAMHARKPTSLTSSTDAEGNISVGQFVFESSKWRKIIPIVHEKAINLFSRLLSGETWREVYKNTSSICLDTTTDDVARSPSFSWKSNNDALSSNSLQLKANVNDHDLNRLSALVQVILHGLGAGSMRLSQVTLLETYQIKFRSATQCYYHSQSKKSINGQHRQATVSNPLVQHKVPPSLVWIILLYRIVLRRYISTSSRLTASKALGGG